MLLSRIPMINSNHSKVWRRISAECPFSRRSYLPQSLDSLSRGRGFHDANARAWPARVALSTALTPSDYSDARFAGVDNLFDLVDCGFRACRVRRANFRALRTAARGREPGCVRIFI